MLAQTFVVYDRYNGHIVCDIKYQYKIFQSRKEALQYICDKNLNQQDFVVKEGTDFDQRTVKEIQSIEAGA